LGREDLTTLEFLSKRIGVRCWTDMQAQAARLGYPKVQRRGDDRGGDQGETDSPAYCPQIEKTAAH
jgi:hypothetical protein